MTLKTLYVCKPVINGDELVYWAKANGFEKTVTPDDLHVTIAFSRVKVDWDSISANTARISNTLTAGRRVKPLGDKGAIVLSFISPFLAKRWRYFKAAGAVWDWPSYQPHITLTYDPAGLSNAEIAAMTPYPGPIILGGEKLQVVKEDWEKNITEKSRG